MFGSKCLYINLRSVEKIWVKELLQIWAEFTKLKPLNTPEFWQKLDSENKIHAKKLVKNVFSLYYAFALQ